MDKQLLQQRLSRFIREDFVPDWRPSRDQWLWALRIGFVLAVLLGILTIIGLPFDVTLWDWLKLLIVPVVLAVGGYLFTRSENRATQAAAERRAQDEALQAYLDQMSNMLLPNEGQHSLYKARPGDSLSSVARARTLSVLPRLDGHRKARVVQFLYEAGLVSRGRPTLRLTEADLRDACLFGATLHGADLSRADLSRAVLREANLGKANLSKANFRDADLRDADLTWANLRRANLSRADLSGADLSGADLSEAQLAWANLSEVKGATVEQLATADLLGATMPDGRVLNGPENPNGPILTEWRKSRDHGEDGENSGP